MRPVDVADESRECARVDTTRHRRGELVVLPELSHVRRAREDNVGLAQSARDRPALRLVATDVDSDAPRARHEPGLFVKPYA